MKLKKFLVSVLVLTSMQALADLPKLVATSSDSSHPRLVSFGPGLVASGLYRQVDCKKDSDLSDSYCNEWVEIMEPGFNLVIEYKSKLENQDSEEMYPTDKSIKKISYKKSELNLEQLQKINNASALTQVFEVLTIDQLIPEQKIDFKQSVICEKNELGLVLDYGCKDRLVYKSVNVLTRFFHIQLK